MKEAFTDCDQDALVLKVEAIGPGVCHEGYESCFFKKLDDSTHLWRTNDVPAFDPKQVYAG